MADLNLQALYGPSPNELPVFVGRPFTRNETQFPSLFQFSLTEQPQYKVLLVSRPTTLVQFFVADYQKYLASLLVGLGPDDLVSFTQSYLVTPDNLYAFMYELANPMTVAFMSRFVLLATGAVLDLYNDSGQHTIYWNVRQAEPLPVLRFLYTKGTFVLTHTSLVTPFEENSLADKMQDRFNLPPIIWQTEPKLRRPTKRNLQVDCNGDVFLKRMREAVGCEAVDQVLQSLDEPSQPQLKNEIENLNAQVQKLNELVQPLNKNLLGQQVLNTGRSDDVERTQVQADQAQVQKLNDIDRVQQAQVQKLNDIDRVQQAHVQKLNELEQAQVQQVNESKQAQQGQVQKLNELEQAQQVQVQKLNELEQAQVQKLEEIKRAQAQNLEDINRALDVAQRFQSFETEARAAWADPTSKLNELTQAQVDQAQRLQVLELEQSSGVEKFDAFNRARVQAVEVFETMTQIEQRVRQAEQQIASTAANLERALDAVASVPETLQMLNQGLDLVSTVSQNLDRLSELEQRMNEAMNRVALSDERAREFFDGLNFVINLVAQQNPEIQSLPEAPTLEISRPEASEPLGSTMERSLADSLSAGNEDSITNGTEI